MNWQLHGQMQTRGGDLTLPCGNRQPIPMPRTYHLRHHIRLPWNVDSTRPGCLKLEYSPVQTKADLQFGSRIPLTRLGRLPTTTILNTTPATCQWDHVWQGTRLRNCNFAVAWGSFHLSRILVAPPPPKSLGGRKHAKSRERAHQLECTVKGIGEHHVRVPQLELPQPRVCTIKR